MSSSINNPIVEDNKAIEISSVPMLVRREIEGLIVVPFIKAFIEEIGEEKALAVTQKVIAVLALKAGKSLAETVGGNRIQHMLEKVFPCFGSGGALEYKVVEATSTSAAANITRCKYAEMYRKHGIEKFGYQISCARDFYLFEGFNPEIKFTRTQTIMEGADFCDFSFELKK